MVKKKSKSTQQEQWKCPENCPDWETKMCKHLQRLMPQENPYSLKPIYNTELTEAQSAKVVLKESIREHEMRKKLQQFNLDAIRIEVIVRRFIYNWSFADIADDLHIPSRQAAYYIYKSALELLKERKFK